MASVRSGDSEWRWSPRLVVWCTLCAALIVLGVCLGLWQWERAADKRLYLEHRDTAPTVHMPETVPPDGARVSLQGRFMGAETLFLDNRTLGQQLGVAVLTPFVDLEGRRWLVERGFIETGVSRMAPSADTPEGTVTISGEWQIDSRRAPRFGDNLEGTRLQRIELASWQQPFTYPGWLHQRQGEGHLLDWWVPSVMPPERHLAYAVQWWALAGVATIALVVGARRMRQDQLIKTDLDAR